jgi:Ca2+-binding RTX toxin-like protein
MRGRAVLVITAVAVALVAASSVVLAANINCEPGIPCLGSPTADTMTGTLQGDDMRGLGGSDTMLARAGGDTLEGGGGNDSLSGGNGDDTYSFSAHWGSDLIPAGGEDAGTDTLDFSLLVDPLQPLDVDLVSSADRDEVYSVYSGAGTLNFPATVQIENVTGWRGRDVIRGNNASNLFDGKAGSDSLYGRGGDDHLIGDLGADALIGGAGNDTIGGAGNDTVTVVDTVYGDNPEVPAETGNDTIDVKDGLKDTVDCGPGTDTVFFDEGDFVTNCENPNPQ